MEVIQDDVEVLCLPDNAQCCAEEEKIGIANIDKCSIGRDACIGDCPYYCEC